MTFQNKWGTVYPESARKYVNPDGFINMNRDVKGLAERLTARARTTKEAVFSIHEFVKNMNVGQVPVLPDVPLRSASDEIALFLRDPGGKHYSYNKVIAEVALLRAVDIPARPATFTCDLRATPPVVTNDRETSIVPPINLHNATEVMVEGNDGALAFMLKESWIPESACKAYPGTCTEDERKEWNETGRIVGIQKFIECTKIADGIGYPGVVAAAIDASVVARNTTRLFDDVGVERGK